MRLLVPATLALVAALLVAPATAAPAGSQDKNNK